MTTDELAKRLTEARDAYYNSDSSLLSDHEFDAMEEELRKKAPSHPFFSFVGASPFSLEKVRHTTPMLSIKKTSIKESPDFKEIDRWMGSLNIAYPLCLEPKIDGLAASCTYEGGRLISVATRGDGITGANVTHLAQYAQGFRHTLSLTEGRWDIRGELYLSRRGPYAKKEGPLRQACSGLVLGRDVSSREISHYEARERALLEQEMAEGLQEKRKQLQREREQLKKTIQDLKKKKESLGSNLQHLFFIAYQIVGPSPTGSESGDLDWLAGEGFATPPFWQISHKAEIEHHWKQYLSSDRHLWDYDTDGLVVVVDKKALHLEIDSYREVTTYHHYILALKPPPLSGSATLTSIAWRLSHRGVLLPVASFSPIRFGKISCERASLHNMRRLRELTLLLGDLLTVERVNDVIPYVKENASASRRCSDTFPHPLIPSRCPFCGTLLKEEEGEVCCPYVGCPERCIQKIVLWVKRAGIEDIGEGTVRHLYRQGIVTNIPALYRLTEEALAKVGKFAEKKIAQFLGQIEKTRTLPIETFILSLGIPSVGEQAIAQWDIIDLPHFLSFEESTSAVGRSVMSWREKPENRQLIDELSSLITVRPSSRKRYLGLIAMTGKGPLPRVELIARIRKKGYQFSPTVTRKTTILLYGEEGDVGKKRFDAEKRGVKLATYEEFFPELFSS